MRFSVYQLSRQGGREKNEDRMGYCYTRDAGLFALADGMGGHPEGEVAAQLALQALAARFQREAQPRLADPLRFLLDAIQAGHQQVLRHAGEHGLLDTPRTTIVACVLQDDAAYWAHCGDSRLYLVRGGRLLARTRDHSYSELQSALAGEAAAGAERPLNRNVLFSCIGSPGKPVVDTVGPVAVRPGDRVMLCSDGLWGTVDDEHIVALLARHGVADGVPALVDGALRAGGERCDNVTVLAVEWEADAAATGGGAVSTHALDDDGFASTIQASLAGDAPESLDEAEIERSIREINDAIQRSAKRRGGPLPSR